MLALVQKLGAEFIEEAEEVAFLQEEPRTLAEILEAEKEFFDKIWYVRKLILREKIERAEEKPLGAAIEERVSSRNRRSRYSQSCPVRDRRNARATRRPQ